MKKTLFEKTISVFLIIQLFLGSFPQNIYAKNQCLAPFSIFKTSIEFLRETSDRILECQIGNAQNDNINRISLMGLYDQLNFELQDYPHDKDVENITNKKLSPHTLLLLAQRIAVIQKIQLLYGDPLWVDEAKRHMYLLAKLIRNPVFLGNKDYLDELLYLISDFLRFGEPTSISKDKQKYTRKMQSVLTRNKNLPFFSSKETLTFWVFLTKLSIDDNASDLEQEAAKQLGKIIFPHIWPDAPLLTPLKKQMNTDRIWKILTKGKRRQYSLYFQRDMPYSNNSGFNLFELPLSYIGKKDVKSRVISALGRISDYTVNLKRFKPDKITIRKRYGLLIGLPLLAIILFNVGDFALLKTGMPYKSYERAEQEFVVRSSEGENVLKSVDMINWLALQNDEILSEKIDMVRSVSNELLEKSGLSVNSMISHSLELKQYKSYLENNFSGHYLIPYLEALESDVSNCLNDYLRTNIAYSDLNNNLIAFDMENLLIWISLHNGKLPHKELSSLLTELNVELNKSNKDHSPFYFFRLDLEVLIKDLEKKVTQTNEEKVLLSSAKSSLEKILKVIPKLPQMKTDWQKGFGRSLKRENYYNNWMFSTCKSYGLPQIIFKAIMLQESNGKSWLRNQRGFAGLMQTGKIETEAAGFSIGSTSQKTTKDGKKYWDYAISSKKGQKKFKKDDRFDARKSIKIGAITLKKKIRSINQFLAANPTMPQPANQIERWKLYIAAYNAGEGTVKRAIRDCYQTDNYKKTKKGTVWKPGSIVWNDLIKVKSGNVLKSSLCRSMPKEWNKKAKYKEITEYVEGVWQRASQSSEPLAVLSNFEWPGESSLTKEAVNSLIETSLINNSDEFDLSRNAVELFKTSLKKANPQALDQSA